jgi:hypothetical protein
MIRWGFIVIGAILPSFMAHAEDGGTKYPQAFAAICAAAINESPDIPAIATSLGLAVPGGLNDASVTIGRTSLRVFNSPQTKQNVVITTNTYSDARTIDCKSTTQGPTPRADLESLAQSLKLEGNLVQAGQVLIGTWKKAGNQPLIFVTMLSSPASTVLGMQRIEVSAPAAKKK